MRRLGVLIPTLGYLAKILPDVARGNLVLMLIRALVNVPVALVAWIRLLIVPYGWERRAQINVACFLCLLLLLWLK